MIDGGWRGSAETWLDAAQQALLEGGIDAVRIQLLGKRMKLSRTSFYWFFKDREELLTALLERWRTKNTGAILRQAGAYAESVVEAVLNVSDCWLDSNLFDSQFEYAVRSWALQSAYVTRSVETADSDRLAALTDMFTRFGYPALEADVRARTVYLVQIGYISMNSREDLALRMERFPHYVEIFTGQQAKQRELARFYARHGFASKQ